MCGIVGYVGKNQASEVLLNGLGKLEYRGYDSAGVALIHDAEMQVIKCKGPLENLAKKLACGQVSHFTCGIGHTRWATHGQPTDVNSHPHRGKHASVVHNGIIENYLPLKQFLLEKGYVFDSDTDTEVVAKLLDFHYDGNGYSTLQKVIKELQGSFALGVIFQEFKDTIFAVRKESPLIVALGEGENFISSDITAILNYTNTYYLIEDFQIAEITPNHILIKDLGGKEITPIKHQAHWTIEDAEKGGHPHFMLKEILEQPAALKKTITPRISKGLPDFQLEFLTAESLNHVEKIYIVACGTAMYAGLMGKNFIESLARIPVSVEIASEFRYKNPILTPKDLVIVVSQSGETADTLAALRLAKNTCQTLAIVNVMGSTISREAHHVIYTWAGTEISVASTKAYSVQVAIFYLLSFQFALAKQTKTPEEIILLVETLTSIPNSIEKILTNTEKIKEICTRFYQSPHLFFLGRNLDFDLCQEASMKLKEVSYIHCESYPSGELKHGSIALIETGTPVIAMATQTSLYEKSVSNMKEVTSRGAHVILICKESAENKSHVCDEFLTIPDIEDFFTPLLATPITQLIAYYTGVLKGCNVDKPRNLAKSVTVE